MLNSETGLLSRDGMQPVRRPAADRSGGFAAAGYANDAAALQPAVGPDLVKSGAEPGLDTEEKEIEFQDGSEPELPPDRSGAANPVPAPPAPKAPVPAQKPAAQPAKQQTAKPAVQVAPKTVAPVRHKLSPDQLCQEYIKFFKDSLGLDLSTAICFENMRRMCEIDVKDPAGTLYFLENTYRVSTLTYLASNLPVLFVTSVLAEKNRKNILKYVTIEVENGSKPYADVLDLRRRRWMRKFENMAVNDAMTVTPGATMLTPELASRLKSMAADISGKLRKFNKEMTGIVAKFDDGARNDIVYIYSNWWYLLQGFENVPEMRSYIMAVTDDTRKNLKV